MATTLAKQLVLDALNMALATRRPRGVIHSATAAVTPACAMEVSRHKSVDVLRSYVRPADLFREHAGASFL